MKQSFKMGKIGDDYQIQEQSSLLRYEDYTKEDQELAKLVKESPELVCARRKAHEQGVSFASYLDEKRKERIVILDLLKQETICDEDVYKSTTHLLSQEVVALRKAKDMRIRPYDYIQLLKNEKEKMEQEEKDRKKKISRIMNQKNLFSSKTKEAIQKYLGLVLYDDSKRFMVMQKSREAATQEHYGIIRYLLSEEDLLHTIFPMLDHPMELLSYFRSLDVSSRVTMIKLLSIEGMEEQTIRLEEENDRLMKSEETSLGQMQILLPEIYFKYITNDFDQLKTYDYETLLAILKWQGFVFSDQVLEYAQKQDQVFFDKVLKAIEVNSYYASATMIEALSNFTVGSAFSMYSNEEIEVLKRWVEMRSQENLYDLNLAGLQECLTYYLEQIKQKVL